MKRFILSICLALLTIAGVQAQSVSKGFKLLSTVSGKTAAQAQKDTAVNTTAKSQQIKLPGYYDIVSVQTQFDKISGTTAGKAYFEGSLTGTTNGWEKVDSLTLTNVASQVKVFSSAPSKYVYYRIRVVPTGTQSTAFFSFGIARKN